MSRDVFFFSFRKNSTTSFEKDKRRGRRKTTLEQRRNERKGKLEKKLADSSLFFLLDLNGKRRRRSRVLSTLPRATRRKKVN